MKNEVDAIAGLQAFPAFPVALVTIQDNIITVATAHMFSFKPPLVTVGICPPRYSYQLIKEVGEFGINIPTKEMIESVEFCGLNSGRDVNKFQETGLTPMEPSKISTKLIQECPVNLECKVLHEVQLPNELQGTHRWFIGSVETAHIDENYDKQKALLYWQKKYRTVGEPFYTTEL